MRYSPSVDNRIRFILEPPTNPSATSSSKSYDIFDRLILAGVDVQRRLKYAIAPATNGEAPLIVALPRVLVPSGTKAAVRIRPERKMTLTR